MCSIKVTGARGGGRFRSTVNKVEYPGFFKTVGFMYLLKEKIDKNSRFLAFKPTSHKIQQIGYKNLNGIFQILLFAHHINFSSIVAVLSLL